MEFKVLMVRGRSLVAARVTGTRRGDAMARNRPEKVEWRIRSDRVS